jgi:hypothetical protein
VLHLRLRARSSFGRRLTRGARGSQAGRD